MVRIEPLTKAMSEHVGQDVGWPTGQSPLGAVLKKKPRLAPVPVNHKNKVFIHGQKYRLECSKNEVSQKQRESKKLMFPHCY